MTTEPNTPITAAASSAAPAAPKASAKQRKPAATKAPKDKNAIWSAPSFTHRRALMVGDAIMEEAGPETVQIGGARSLIKGSPLNEHFRKSRGVKSFGHEVAQTSATKDEPHNLVQGSIVQTSPLSPGVRVAFEMALTPADIYPAQNGNESDLTSQPVLRELFSVGPAAADHPVDQVAMRLTLALLSGSWLWRNRTLASTIRIRFFWRTFHHDGSITTGDQEVSNARTWPQDPAQAVEQESCRAASQSIADQIAATLRHENLVTRFFVEAWLDLPASTRVFPSQLRTDDKERQYFKVPGGQGNVGLTAEKISNRLRTIDAWHGHASFPNVSFPVEIYGSSLEYGINIRDKEEKSLLGIWKKLVCKGGHESVKAVLESLSADDKCFMVAWFLRGGAGVYKGAEASATPAASNPGAPTPSDTVEAAAGDKGPSA
jgi:hypothetical protein